MLIDFNGMSRVILYLEVKELHTLYIYIFCVVAKEFFVHSYLIFLSNTNNLHKFLWLQVFLSNTNNYVFT